MNEEMAAQQKKQQEKIEKQMKEAMDGEAGDKA